MGMTEAYDRITNSNSLYSNLKYGIDDWEHPQDFIEAVIEAYNIIKEENIEDL